MKLDEHTETTLARVYLGEPVPKVEIEHAARALVAKWTDPADPDNYLKRPTWCTCANVECRKRYRSRLKLLARSEYCSPECREAAEKQLRDILGIDIYAEKE